MSIQTLFGEATIPPKSDSAASSPFDTVSFDEAVMSTYGRFPLALERGAGSRVWDTQGREYLDFVAGIATCTLGHAHPAMVAAVTRQIQKLHHVSNLYYIPEQGELAKWIIQHSCADRVFLLIRYCPKYFLSFPKKNDFLKFPECTTPLNQKCHNFF